ncbi:hypothetical protein QFZ53_001490 [Microbacterium natoriense]|uniref:Uncharacterized protein n=1 Tax=Microbacterium natoriense TaxID=284570 RepID=A0AAW8EXB0_9MICO|nr:hypothetical protein [Microbacterium natoriense]MDQ0647294.1 hypothetical protein [Microbacterium natoriense]
MIVTTTAEIQEPVIVTVGELLTSRRPSNVATSGMPMLVPFVKAAAARSMVAIATIPTAVTAEAIMTNTRSIFSGSRCDMASSSVTSRSGR